MAGILGVVLVAASPPAPEPIDEQRRAEMIGWVADGAVAHDDAGAFVDANTARTASPFPTRPRDRRCHALEPRGLARLAGARRERGLARAC